MSTPDLPPVSTPIVLALASNERYFPGLYCAVASALTSLSAARHAVVHVLDGGVSEESKVRLESMAKAVRPSTTIEWRRIDQALFENAEVGPGHSHMTYARLLVPDLVMAQKCIYLDVDILVFRDLAVLFDTPLTDDTWLMATPDAELLTLGDDAPTVAAALGLSSGECYFNAGVLLMNLPQLRQANVLMDALAFLRTWRGSYHFHDQSAINYLLHRHIKPLPAEWNRPAWIFDQQQDNHTDCLLHYTSTVPWLTGRPGPAQALYEKFAEDWGIPVDVSTAAFRRSCRRWWWRGALAPFRAVLFALLSLSFYLLGGTSRAIAYDKAARYWNHFIRTAAIRRRLGRERIAQIRRTQFSVPDSVTHPSVSSLRTPFPSAPMAHRVSVDTNVDGRNDGHGPAQGTMHLALASNERYFPGLYCTVASSLASLGPGRAVTLHILDGGIRAQSAVFLENMVRSLRPGTTVEWIRTTDTLFRHAYLAPHQSSIAYSRITLPDAVSASTCLYLDCDLLVFRDLSELYDGGLDENSALGAVLDAQTLTLADDAPLIAAAMGLPPDGRYFNSGVLLMNLDRLRTLQFSALALDFLSTWKGKHRFHDQSVINYLLHHSLTELPEYWNRPSWVFDEQDDNHLDCVLHYTTAAPWLGGNPGPAQVLFERVASTLGLPVDVTSPAFRKSRERWRRRELLAPLRASAFPIAAHVYRWRNRPDRADAYQRAGRYWEEFVRTKEIRQATHQRRIAAMDTASLGVPTPHAFT